MRRIAPRVCQPCAVSLETSAKSARRSLHDPVQRPVPPVRDRARRGRGAINPARGCRKVDGPCCFVCRFRNRAPPLCLSQQWPRTYRSVVPPGGFTAVARRSAAHPSRKASLLRVRRAVPVPVRRVPPELSREAHIGRSQARQCWILQEHCALGTLECWPFGTLPRFVCARAPGASVSAAPSIGPLGPVCLRCAVTRWPGLLVLMASRVAPHQPRNVSRWSGMCSASIGRPRVA